MRIRLVQNPDKETRHRWFAWFPVMTVCNTVVWLETVDRKFIPGYEPFYEYYINP